MIITDRCLIRKLETSDKEFYFEMQKNISVRKYLGGVKDDANIITSFKKIINGTDLYWIVIEKETNAKIGIISIDTYYDQISKELSFEFIDTSWGNGYAYECIIELLNIFFKVHKIKQIISETQSENAASIRLLKTLGFIFQEEIMRHGELQHVFVYKY